MRLTKDYFITKLTQVMDPKEAMEVFNKACNEVGIDDKEYEDMEFDMDVFVKLANAIKNQGRLARFIGSMAIVEANASANANK